MLQNTSALQDEAGAIGQRWAEALRRRYPAPHTAKKIAQAFKVDTRTAEAWLTGNHGPYAKYLLRAWRLHGFGIVAEVIAPGSELAQAAPIDTALSDLERQLQKLGDELARLKVEKA